MAVVGGLQKLFRSLLRRVLGGLLHQLELRGSAVGSWGRQQLHLCLRQSFNCFVSQKICYLTMSNVGWAIDGLVGCGWFSEVVTDKSNNMLRSNTGRNHQIKLLQRGEIGPYLI